MQGRFYSSEAVCRKQLSKTIPVYKGDLWEWVPGNKWILPALGLPRELFLPICGQFSGSLPSPLGFGRFELLLADFGGAKTSESTARSNPARTDCGLFG